MTDKHPYISAPKGINEAIIQFRKSFPQQVTSETLKKLGIAPNNESYVINIMRFLRIIDTDGNKTPEGISAFTQHEDAAFQKSFSALVGAAYSLLFELHGENAWHLPNDKLIAFFRVNDQSTEIVGKRQARTFEVLALHCGHGNGPTQKAVTATNKNMKNGVTQRAPKAPVQEAPKTNIGGKSTAPSSREVGLTVRIEINLPVADDQKTYDRIFKSIRENLLTNE